MQDELDIIRMSLNKSTDRARSHRDKIQKLQRETSRLTSEKMEASFLILSNSTLEGMGRLRHSPL